MSIDATTSPTCPPDPVVETHVFMLYRPVEWQLREQNTEYLTTHCLPAAGCCRCMQCRTTVFLASRWPVTYHQNSVPERNRWYIPVPPKTSKWTPCRIFHPVGDAQSRVDIFSLAQSSLCFRQGDQNGSIHDDSMVWTLPGPGPRQLLCRGGAVKPRPTRTGRSTTEPPRSDRNIRKSTYSLHTTVYFVDDVAP